MNSKLVERYNISSGLILLGMAMAHFVGNQGRGVLQPSDPVFQISTRYLFWILAGVEAAVAIVCLFTKSFRFSAVSILWLTSNLFLYRLSLFFFGVKTFNAYYDTMAYSFGISAGAVNLFQTLATSYLWVGSVLLLFLLRKESKRNEAAVAQTRTDVVRA